MNGQAVRATLWMALLAVITGGALIMAANWLSASDAATARAHVVDIRGFEYHPSSLAIARGDTVVWINRDVVPHTATAVEHGWDSGELAAGARWPQVFTEAQRTQYTCTLHPGMRGTLVVE